MSVSEEDMELDLRKECEAKGTRVPNILICGTPGTGKTTVSFVLAEKFNLRHLDISKMAVERQLHTEYDASRETFVLDEDKVIDELDDGSGVNMMGGGYIVDYHSCDFFPERFFDLVLVLQAQTQTLWERLEERHYPTSKIQENVEAEIMHGIPEEARNSYQENIVHFFQNNEIEDIDTITEFVKDWASQKLGIDS